MKLSLSVRIVEAACKTKLLVPFEQLVSIAKGADTTEIVISAVGRVIQ